MDGHWELLFSPRKIRGQLYSRTLSPFGDAAPAREGLPGWPGEKLDPRHWVERLL